MTKIRLAGAALNQTPLDWENNIENIRQAIAIARSKQVAVLCLPELCITGYGSEDLFYSRWLPDKALRYIDLIKSWCQQITVAVGLPVWHQQKLYNCTCLIHNQQIQGFIPKQHLANEGVHYEGRWFTAWSPGVLDKFQYGGKDYPFGDRIYHLHGVNIGFEICEDAWVGDQRPACRLFEQGVQLILNPSASHFAFEKSAFRKNLVTESSKLFNCAYVYSNLLGNETGRMIFDGDIFIAQNGRLVQRNTKLSFKQVNLTTALIDFDDPQKSSARFNADTHDTKVEFTKAVTLALFDYLRKSRSKGFVISLSGGADSSICTVLVAEMVRRGMEELGIAPFLEKLGTPQLIARVKGMTPKEAERQIISSILTCAYQATENSSDATASSAENLAHSLGATFHRWSVDEEVRSYRSKVENVLKRPLQWNTDDIALQNIQARARAPIIWMLANIKNALLISTSNRSEGDVGYATMDGDTCGSISPIAAVDKQFILEWLIWAEHNLDYPGLAEVNRLQPTAELRPPAQDQTDEADLMPYKIIVAIERLAIKEHLSPEEVFLQLKPCQLEEESLLIRHIMKFFRLWARNQWKRERLAPSFHLDDFNIDPKTWCRFPILSGGFREELEELEKHLNHHN